MRNSFLTILVSRKSTLDPEELISHKCLLPGTQTGIVLLTGKKVRGDKKVPCGVFYKNTDNVKEHSA